MTSNPNKLARFWKELKRRRVIHVITVYASAAFVLIELVNNLTEPLNLPPGLATIVIVILAAGFPLTVILSWVYDLTGKGWERTKPIEEIPEESKEKVSNGWKIATYLSFAVILGLVAFQLVRSTGQFMAADMQSLMILPIENYTGDDGLDEFISGMHSALITDVGRISKLKVKSKTTSVACADKSPEDIVAEQGVDVILVPTFMCLADSVCFQMKAITSEGEEVWISDYQEPKSQLQNLTNSITMIIAEEVNVKLTAGEKRILTENRTTDPDAFEAWVTGQRYWDQLNKNDLELAKRYFERAIEIDPDWPPPYAGLAFTWGALMSFGNVPDSIGQPKRYEYLYKALELDSLDAYVQYVLAGISVWNEWDWEKGERAFVTSLKLNPNNARCRIYYAHLLDILRRSEEALDQAKLAVQLDPLNPLILGLYVVVMINNDQCDEALEYLKMAQAIDPDHSFLQGRLHKIYECMGEYDKIFKEWREITLPLWERYGVTEILDSTYQEHGYIAFVEEESRINKEIMKEIPFGPNYFFNQHLTIGQYDKAMDYLEIFFTDLMKRGKYQFLRGKTDMAYIGTKPYFSKMKDNPRYIELLKKMNLPVE